MSKTYIVDGNSLLFRAYYSTAYTGNFMKTSFGTPTNAVFAFHNLIKKIKAEVKSGDHLFVAFDTDKPTKRSQEFDEYKAQRAPCPVELIMQFSMARELLDAMNIYWKEVPGYEADDLAGSMARYASNTDQEVRLFSSDKDFLQLLSIKDNVIIEVPKKGLKETILYTQSNLHELFGLNPDQITDFKGIAGDPSDNYKGIAGVGEKTAKKLLNEHGHLEELIQYCKEHQDSKINQKIVAGEKEALFFKHLATIDTDIDMKEDYEKAEYKPYIKSKLAAFYQKYEMHSFLKKIDTLTGLVDDFALQMRLFDIDETEDVKNDVHKFTKKDIHAFSEIKDDIIGISYDSDYVNENVDELRGFSLATKDTIFYLSKEDALKDKVFKSFVKKDKHIACYDYKSLLVLLNRNGFDAIEGIDFDLLLATYLVNPNSGQKVKDLFISYDIDLKADERLSDQIIANTLLLKDDVISKLKENESLELFKNVELPLARVIANMEIEGFPLDKDTLEKINNEYSQIVEDTKQDIYQLIGKEFNLNSPKQLDQVLFTDLGIKRFKNEKGTSSEVLMSHINDHPVIPLIIKYRLFSKLVSTYTSALPKHLQADHKIHAIYNQALTATGRLSMSEPNLQNISIRSAEGKNIRKAFFYPDKDHLILSLDYSQIELRMLAHLGDIKILKEIFNEGLDIHTATASRVFKVPIEEVTPDMRRKAKAVNFGIIYGISSYGLSQQLEISREEAKELIESFKDTFTGIDEFQKQCINFARTNGYVTTILNRRRYLKDINSSNKALRAFSERAAVNSVIQGSAADLIKVAMIKCFDILKSYKTKIILQIHDELLFSVPKEELNTVEPLLRKAMETAMPLTVPLKVDGAAAETWYEAH